MRKTQTHFFQYPLLLFPLIAFVLLCAACGGPVKQKTLTPPASTPTPDQPVTKQQLFSAGPFTYVALGASDAVGVGSTHPATDGYVPQLAQRLPAGSHMVNLGISGIHLHEALSRELPLALSAQPRLITIWLVANDFVAGVPFQGYMQDLTSLLQQLRNNTHARIVMANLPDLTRLPSFARLTAEQKTRVLAEIQHWNASMSTIATKYQVTLVDLFQEGSQLTSHPEYVSYDGFHPSNAGYQQLTNFFWQAIHG